MKIMALINNGEMANQSKWRSGVINGINGIKKRNRKRHRKAKEKASGEKQRRVKAKINR
jgi:hypothetical protein